MKSVSQVYQTIKKLSNIWNRKLMFHQHINFYTDKVLFIVKNIKMLGNSTWNLLLY